MFLADFHSCITLDCLEIESPFQRQWIRPTESIPLGLRGRTNFAAGRINDTACTHPRKRGSTSSQDGLAVGSWRSGRSLSGGVGSNPTSDKRFPLVCGETLDRLSPPRRAEERRAGKEL